MRREPIDPDTQRFGVGFELVALPQLQAFETRRLGESVDEDGQVVDEPLVLQLVHGEVGLDPPEGSFEMVGLGLPHSLES